MKERILKVIVICAWIFAIGFTILIAIVSFREVAIAIISGITAIIASAIIQYITIGNWHPTYLFKNNNG